MSTPTQVSLTGVVSVAAGARHSAALRSDGTVWAWGNNSTGQLGNNNTVNQSTPVQTSHLSGALMVSAGNDFNVALRGDGTLWAWGVNTLGNLGDATTLQRNTPVQTANIVFSPGSLAGSLSYGSTTVSLSPANQLRNSTS